MEDNLNLTEKQKRELKKIVLARIQVMPDNLNVSIGERDIDKKELTRLIQNEDEIGKQMMLTELEFLRDLASGAIYANE